MTDLAPDSGPAALPTLELAQIASAREHWVSLGLDPSRFDDAASGAAPTAPGRALEPTEPAVVDGVSPSWTPSLTPQHAQEMAAALIASGVPQDQVDAALRADGFGQAAPDSRTDEQKEFDRSFAGAAPHEYKIDYMGRVPGDFTTTALVELNKLATTWLSAIAFPPDIGPAVVERALDVATRLKAMGEPERELWRREQEISFERLAGGPEEAANRLEIAAQVLARGPKGFTDLLINGGAANDAGVLMFLALQGERLSFNDGMERRQRAR